MTRTLSEKILVLGVDGMDPRLAKHYMDEGKMPNLKKFVERGAAREDLVLLGAHPTVTPPMWTTLSTGAYPRTHGITDFNAQSPDDLDIICYNFDSRKCKAEQLWNIFAENGKKTLVFHWPGSSWPPTSTSENLHVIDGLTPSQIGMSNCVCDNESVLVADEKIEKVVIHTAVKASSTGAGCIIDDLEPEKGNNKMDLLAVSHEIHNIELSYKDGDESTEEVGTTYANVPIKPASGWANAPADAREFVLVQNGGLIRRPALLLKNENGIYDHVEVYEKKDQAKPLCTMKLGEPVNDYYDAAFRGDEKRNINRTLKMLDCAEDGSHVRIYLGRAMDYEVNNYVSPASLHRQLIDSCGMAPTMPCLGGFKYDLLSQALIPLVANYCEWQSKAIRHLIDANGYEVVFSHLHNIDLVGHIFFRLAKARSEHPEVPSDKYAELVEQVYIDTDRYLGDFLPYIDKGYTIFIVSDHGGIIPDEERAPLLGDPFGVNAKILYDLGYTGLKKDEDGNLLPEIDWETTTAVAPRAAFIWVNLKGRDKHGIVDPADKYELERKIIDDLYNYRDPQTGKRVISLAVRRKDAVHFGLDGEDCGDIVYFVEEGMNRLHGDSLSSFYGVMNTSVSPIFIAAGPGIKEGYVTDRVIREVDVAPTIAAVTGIRMPAQCEGAPAYQILDGDVVCR